MTDGESDLKLHLHLDTQFVHRPLAAQAFGADQGADISRLADQVAEAIVSQQVPDIRVTAVEDSLPTIANQVVTVRSGFYFRREGAERQRIHFHDKIRVDQDIVVEITGELDPHRFEANSAWTNLSGRRNVLIVGIARDIKESPLGVRIRPILIGDPYYSRSRSAMKVSFHPQRPELFCVDVDQFNLTEHDGSRVASEADLMRLFKMPEQQVKEAFGQILGLSSVPADWGGEHSDLTANVSIMGMSARAAFAFKGPGGRLRPWTLHPADMGRRGDQAVRLFAEAADLMVVQHCSRIAENVRHIMNALATQHGKSYMLIDGDDSVRILNRAGLLSA